MFADFVCLILYLCCALLRHQQATRLSDNKQLEKVINSNFEEFTPKSKLYRAARRRLQNFNKFSEKAKFNELTIQATTRRGVQYTDCTTAKMIKLIFNYFSLFIHCALLFELYFNRPLACTAAPRLFCAFRKKQLPRALSFFSQHQGTNNNSFFLRLIAEY